MQVSTISGDSTGTLHILNRTTLAAASTPSQTTYNLHIYAGATALLPSSVIVGANLTLTSRGIISGLDDMVVEQQGLLVLGGEFALETVDISGTARLVTKLLNMQNTNFP